MKKYPPHRSWLAACVAAHCLLVAVPAMSASFDCSKANSANEKIICNDPQLSTMDEQLAKTFRLASKKAADRRAFNAASEQQWLWREKNCHTREELLEWYGKRQSQLEAALTANAASAAPAALAAQVSTPPPESAPAHQQTALQLRLSEDQIAEIAPDGVSARPHYLSANRGEYLYADPEAKNGDNNTATVSVHYLGIENGQYILEARRDDVYTRYTCSADCELIGALQLPGDVEKDMIIINNDHTSLPSLIVTDAINGLLAESGIR